MGFLVDSQRDGGGDGGYGMFGGCVRTLVRRKQVDSAHTKPETSHQKLAKNLTIPHLVAIGNLSNVWENLIWAFGVYFNGFV